MFLLHSVLVNWKCLPLQKADWELRKAQKVCLSLGNWKSILKLCFPVSILSEQRGKLFSCVCVKKIRSQRPSTIDFSTWKEQGKESWSLLSSIRVLWLSACVQMIYFEKPTLHLKKFWNGAPVPLGVSARRIL